MVPATRSGIDVSFWILERAASERVAMSLPKLRWLLYLAQAHYAIAREGAKLMPVTFVAAEDGPLEPTLDLVFQAGLENPWSPALSETAGSFLEGFWKRFGALPAVALHKLVLGDPSWKRAQENGPGSEVHVEQHRANTKALPISAPRGGTSKGSNAKSAAARAAELPPFEDEVKAKIEQYSKAPAAGRVVRSTSQASATPQVSNQSGSGQAGAAAATGGKTTPRTASVGESVAHLRAAPPDSQEIRFTADGRSVTRWRPKRRVDGPTI